MRKTMRACIGRQLALTEAKLAIALILKNFALSDPYDYKLDVKQTLTVKPEGFRIHDLKEGSQQAGLVRQRGD